jgi:hypothetical protein
MGLSLYEWDNLIMCVVSLETVTFPKCYEVE